MGLYIKNILFTIETSTPTHGQTDPESPSALNIVVLMTIIVIIAFVLLFFGLRRLYTLYLFNYFFFSF